MRNAATNTVGAPAWIGTKANTGFTHRYFCIISKCQHSAKGERLSIVTKEVLPMLLCVVAHSCLTLGPCGFPGGRPRGIPGRPHFELLAPVGVLSWAASCTMSPFFFFCWWRLTFALFISSVCLHLSLTLMHVLMFLSPVRSAVSDNAHHAHTRALFAEAFWDLAPLGLLHSSHRTTSLGFFLLSGFQFPFLDLLSSFVYALLLLEHIFQSFLWVKNVSRWSGALGGDSLRRPSVPGHSRDPGASKHSCLLLSLWLSLLETRLRSRGRDDPLEKEMAAHPSTLVWRIPWTEEPGGLQSMGSQSCTRPSAYTLRWFSESNVFLWSHAVF